MSIPILWQYDNARVVGYLNGNIATFLPGTVTPDDMPTWGYRIEEAEQRDGRTYVKKAKVLCMAAGIPLAPLPPPE